MFLENPAYNNEQFGWIEVICGSMFSGKTEELIRRVKRAKIANQKVKIFKPIVDSRSKNYIESHDDNKLESIEVKSSSEILNNIENCDVVAIDEAQFFNNEIVDNNQTFKSNISYFKKVVKPTEEEKKNHQQYLKNNLKKNFFN